MLSARSSCADVGGTGSLSRLCGVPLFGTLGAGVERLQLSLWSATKSCEDKGCCVESTGEVAGVEFVVPKLRNLNIQIRGLRKPAAEKKVLESNQRHFSTHV